MSKDGDSKNEHPKTLNLYDNHSGPKFDHLHKDSEQVI